MTNGTVLAVDDTTDSLRLLSELLSAEGYTVRPADGGDLALASAYASPPDIILLDIRMPGMDGFEVCRQLKASDATRDIPVIFLSAATELDERVQGLSLGAVDFISKPYQREELLVRVRTHLDLALLRSKLERLVSDRTAELNDANKRLREAAAFQRAFLRDVLASVTNGGLVLCHDATELPATIEPSGESIELCEGTDLRALRELARTAAVRVLMPEDRANDLITAAHEAGMNSIVHVGSGIGRVFCDEAAGRVQVRIEDKGPGIALDHLPQATLQRGYSTAGTFGHGMKMMLSMVDHIYLHTAPTGTTVVIEQDRVPPADRLLRIV